MTTATAGETRIMTDMTDTAIATHDIMILRITSQDTEGRIMNRTRRAITTADPIL